MIIKKSHSHKSIAPIIMKSGNVKATSSKRQDRQLTQKIEASLSSAFCDLSITRQDRQLTQKVETSLSTAFCDLSITSSKRPLDLEEKPVEKRLFLKTYPQDTLLAQEIRLSERELDLETRLIPIQAMQQPITSSRISDFPFAVLERQMEKEDLEERIEEFSQYNRSSGFKKILTSIILFPVNKIRAWFY